MLQLTIQVMGANRMSGTDWTDEEAAAVTGSALGAYCPEELDRLAG